MPSSKCRPFCLGLNVLTHWGRVTHICVSEIIIIGSDNGLSPGRRQAIIWTNAGILLIGPWGTNFSEILIGVHTFSFKKIHLNMFSAKCRPFCLCLNVLRGRQAEKIWDDRSHWLQNNGQTSNIRRTKSQHLNIHRLLLWLSWFSPLKSCVYVRMKM